MNSYNGVILWSQVQIFIMISLWKTEYRKTFKGFESKNLS